MIFAALLTPSLAHAGPVRSSAGAAVKGVPLQIAYSYQQDLLKLRNEIIQQQKQDGGTLKNEHLAMFQVRLDAVNKRFAKVSRNANPLSVGGSGHTTDVAFSDWTSTDLFLTGRQ